MALKAYARLTVAITALGILAACEGGPKLPFLQGKSATGGAAQASSSTRLVERDIEAPEVFQKTEEGLWDGRPSLGGVWVAHPDVTDPERVIIRNESNGKFVIGALFRRERENPGPKLQLSSDAAASLGVLAGAPTRLNVTALRKQEVEELAGATTADTAPDTLAEIATPTNDGAAAAEATVALSRPAQIDAATLSPPTPVPQTAISAGVTAPATASNAVASTPQAPRQPVRVKRSSALKQPYIQIGFYSVEENADRAGAELRKTGIVPTIRKQSTSGKTFWRVLVGPAATETERTQLLNAIKSRGYKDAYFVTD